MSSDQVIEVEKLKKYFPLKKGFFQTFLSREEETVTLSILQKAPSFSRR